MSFNKKPILGSVLNTNQSLVKSILYYWLMNEGGGNKIFDLVNKKWTADFRNDEGEVTWGVDGLAFSTVTDNNDDDHFVDIDSTITFPEEFTIIAELTPKGDADLTYDEMKLCGQHSTTSGNYGCILVRNYETVTNLQFSFSTTGSNFENVVSTDNSFPINTKMIVALVVTNTTVDFYFNGVHDVQRTRSATGQINNNTGLFYIGSESGFSRQQNRNCWSGLYNRLMIVGKAMTASEILQDYTSPYQIFEPVWIPSFAGELSSTILPINFNQQRRIMHTNLRR